jgi:hypothetical protein
MLYMVTWNISEENFGPAVERWQAGDELPEGVTMVGRWHAPGAGYGWTLLEADDPIAVAKLGLHWADLVSQEVTPVMTDDQIAQAMS